MASASTGQLPDLSVVEERVESITVRRLHTEDHEPTIFGLNPATAADIGSRVLLAHPEIGSARELDRMKHVFNEHSAVCGRTAATGVAERVVPGTIIARHDPPVQSWVHGYVSEGIACVVATEPQPPDPYQDCCN